MESTNEANLEKCLDLLKGPTDEERFVGLLLVTKLVKNNDLLSIRKIYNAIGFQFIDRLLRTPSNDNASDNLPYQNIALSILSTYCALEDLLVNPNMLEKVPLLLEILSKTQEVQVKMDAFHILASFYQNEIGKSTIITFLGNNISPFVAYCCFPSLHESQLSESVQFLNRLLGDTSLTQLNENRLASDLQLLIPMLTSTFETNNNQLKFEILELLNSIFHTPLMNASKRLFPNTTNNNWLQSIRNGLFSILSSRINYSTRSTCFSLAACLFDHFDLSWSLESKFIELFIRLVSIEVRLFLEEYSEKITSENQQQDHSLSVEKLNVLADCYHILECIIHLFSEDNELVEHALSKEIIERISKIFLETFGILVQFLQIARDQKRVSDPVVLASTRVLGAWLAEESSALRSEVCDILPFLLSVEDKSDSPIDPIEFLMPGLLHLTSDDKSRKQFLDNKGHAKLLRYFQLHYKELLNPSKSKSHGREDGSLANLLGVLINLVCLSDSIDLIFVGFLPILNECSSAIQTAVSGVPNNSANEDNLLLLLNISIGIAFILKSFDEKKIHAIYSSRPELILSIFGELVSLLKTMTNDSFVSTSFPDLWLMLWKGVIMCIGKYPTLGQTLRESPFISQISKSLFTISDLSPEEKQAWRTATTK